MYNDNITTIGGGIDAMVVVLDLSAGNALQLIKSIFSNRTQRVKMFCLTVLIFFCDVPQCSVSALF